MMNTEQEPQVVREFVSELIKKMRRGICQGGDKEVYRSAPKRLDADGREIWTVELKFDDFRLGKKGQLKLELSHRAEVLNVELTGCLNDDTPAQIKETRKDLLATLGRKQKGE